MDTLTITNLTCHDHGPYSLVLQRGTCVGISGPSGAGKTLLLRSLADLEPHTGTVQLDGIAATAIPAPTWRRQVMLIPAASHWWRETVAEHFRHWDADRAAILDLPPDIPDWPVDRLSAGERQRLALLRGLQYDPVVLLLDEPTAHLDRESRRRVEELVTEWRRQTAGAVIWVGHDHDQLRRVADRILTLSAGSLKPQGPDS
jgi:ABC-type iron transport system FetAB ATPase subunit